MGYLRKRILQPSTWLGVASAGLALASSGGAFTPAVISALLAALGLVHIDDSTPAPSA